MEEEAIAGGCAGCYNGGYDVLQLLLHLHPTTLYGVRGKQGSRTQVDPRPPVRRPGQRAVDRSVQTMLHYVTMTI